MEEEILLGITFQVFGILWGIKNIVIKENIDKNGIVKGVT